MTDPEPLATAVLRRFSVCQHGCTAVRVHSNGLSGACLWRVEVAAAGPCCLRLWPPNDSFPAQLDFIHRLMTSAHAAGLHMVPRLFLADDQRSRIEHEGGWWELTEWRPGRADFRENTTPARLEAACRVLAQLHRAWRAEAPPGVGPCPAVGRRCAAAAAWRSLRDAEWNPVLILPERDPWRPIVERAMSAVERWLPSVMDLLRQWEHRESSLQPCLCDVRHDHLLFQGDELTGLVDFGALQLDAVAVDLARMLGSMVEDDEAAWTAGLAAYRSVGRFSDVDEALAHMLDQTGAVLGLANWLRWLYAERRRFDNREAVRRRLELLLGRMTRWEDAHRSVRR